VTGFWLTSLEKNDGILMIIEHRRGNPC